MISNQKVRNIGTPSVDNITIAKKANETRYNEWALNIRFHYSPDGSHDLPGTGYVMLNPLRDFIKNGTWIGGVRENYGDWEGVKDSDVELAFQRIGFVGKIGQRDMFILNENGTYRRYYIYESNKNAQFSWENWRIILYSEDIRRAILIPLDFQGVVDFANPHISLLRVENGRHVFWISFFIPSEAIKPPSQITAGEFTGIVSILP